MFNNDNDQPTLCDVRDLLDEVIRDCKALDDAIDDAVNHDIELILEYTGLFSLYLKAASLNIHSMTEVVRNLNSYESFSNRYIKE